jgi:hypothetical protein
MEVNEHSQFSDKNQTEEFFETERIISDGKADY